LNRGHDPEPGQELWYIPLSYTSKSSPNFDPAPEEWMNITTSLTTISHDTTEWIIVNAGAHGMVYNYK